MSKNQIASSWTRIFPMMVLLLCALTLPRPALGANPTSPPFESLLSSPQKAQWPDGWSYKGGEQGEREIRFHFEHPQLGSLELVVQPKSARGNFFRVTRNFKLSYNLLGDEPEGEAPALNALLDAVVRRIEANGSQEYFVDKGDSPAHSVDLPAFLGLEDDSKEVRPGWRLVSADALRDQVVYLFDSPLGGQVRLYAAEKDPEREAFASTDLFTVWFDVEGEFPETDEARQELDAFLGQVVERLDKFEPEHSPFVRLVDSSLDIENVKGSGPTNPDTAPPILLGVTMVLWLLGALALLLVLWRTRETLLNLPRWELHALLWMVLLAAALRFVVAPHELVKVGMFYPLMDNAVNLAGLPRYGPGGPVLYHFLFTFFPISTVTVLSLHSLLASLGIFLGAVLARKLFPRDGVALAFALLAGFTPVFIRDANSESLLVVGFFLWLLFVLSWIRARDTGSLLDLAAGWAAATLFIHTRPEAFIIVLLTCFFLLPRFFRKMPVAGGLAMLLMALVSIPLILFLRDTVGYQAGQGNIQFEKIGLWWLVTNWFEMNLAFRPASFPVVTTVAALLGLVLTLRDKELRWNAAGLFLLGAAWLAVYFIDFNEESLLRLHVPGAMVWSMLGAGALGELLHLVKKPSLKCATGFAVATLFLVSAVPTASQVFFKTNSNQEDALLLELVKELPDEPVTLVHLAHEDRPLMAVEVTPDSGKRVEGGAPIHRDFPEYLLKPPLRNDRLMAITHVATQGRRKDGRTFFYLSPLCYAHRDAGGFDSWGVTPDPYVHLHPACRWFLLNHHLTPVDLRYVPNYGEYAYVYQWYPPELKGMTVGLLEVSGEKEPTAEKDSFRFLADEYYERARPFIIDNDMEQARCILEEGYQALPDSIAMWLHMASFYYLYGNRSNQQEHFETALSFLIRVAEKDIGYTNVLSLLGSTFFGYSKYFEDDDLRGFFEYRLARNKDDYVGLYLKGLWLFYRDWDYTESLKYFERILERKQDEPRVFVYLALDHYYLGHQKKAEEYAQRAVDVGAEVDADVWYVRSIVNRRNDLQQCIEDLEIYLAMSEGEERVTYPKKQIWLTRELKMLKEGKRGSVWWRSKDRSEPWNLD